MKICFRNFTYQDENIIKSFLINHTLEERISQTDIVIFKSFKMNNFKLIKTLSNNKIILIYLNDDIIRSNKEFKKVSRRISQFHNLDIILDLESNLFLAKKVLGLRNYFILPANYYDKPMLTIDKSEIKISYYDESFLDTKKDLSKVRIILLKEKDISIDLIYRLIYHRVIIVIEKCNPKYESIFNSFYQYVIFEQKDKLQEKLDDIILNFKSYYYNIYHNKSNLEIFLKIKHEYDLFYYLYQSKKISYSLITKNNVIDITKKVLAYGYQSNKHGIIIPYHSNDNFLWSKLYNYESKMENKPKLNKTNFKIKLCLKKDNETFYYVLSYHNEYYFRFINSDIKKYLRETYYKNYHGNKQDLKNLSKYYGSLIKKYPEINFNFEIAYHLVLIKQLSIYNNSQMIINCNNKQNTLFLNKLINPINIINLTNLDNLVHLDFNNNILLLNQDHKFIVELFEKIKDRLSHFEKIIFKANLIRYTPYKKIKTSLINNGFEIVDVYPGNSLIFYSNLYQIWYNQKYKNI